MFWSIVGLPDARSEADVREQVASRRGTRPALNLTALVLVLGLALLACGGASAESLPGVQPLPFNSPSLPPNSSNLAPCGTKNGSAYTISGKIVDAITQQPINGSVFVWIDFMNGAALDLLRASPDGSFASDRLVLSETSFALVFAAISSSGVYYQPVILLPGGSCNIGPGTEIGTLGLSPGAGSANITATATATTAQGQPALVNAQPALFEQAGVIHWAMPWGVVWPPPRNPLQAGSSCPSSTACTTFTTGVSASPAVAGTYAGSATSFTPVGPQASYVLQISWAPGSALFGQCTPITVQLGPLTAAPNDTVNFGTASFTGC